MTAPDTKGFDSIEVEAAIVQLTGTAYALDVMIDHATENPPAEHAVGALIEMGRHFLADLEALRKVFFGDSYTEPGKGGAE